MSLALLNRDLAPQGVRAFSLEPGAAPANSDMLDGLTRFIPTEILAPYVSLLSFANSNDTFSTKTIYWCFVVLTPLLTVFFQFASSAMDEIPWPPLKAVVWRALLAAVAFIVWGLAPPHSPFQDALGGPAVAGISAVLISPILTGADAIGVRLLRIRKKQ